MRSPSQVTGQLGHAAASEPHKVKGHEQLVLVEAGSGALAGDRASRRGGVRVQLIAWLIDWSGVCLFDSLID